MPNAVIRVETSVIGLQDSVALGPGELAEGFLLPTAPNRRMVGECRPTPRE